MLFISAVKVGHFFDSLLEPATKWPFEELEFFSPSSWLNFLESEFTVWVKTNAVTTVNVLSRLISHIYKQQLLLLHSGSC